MMLIKPGLKLDLPKMVYRKPDVDVLAFLSREAKPIIKSLTRFEIEFIGMALNFFAGTDDALKELYYQSIISDNAEQIFLVEVSPIIELFVVVRNHQVWILKANRY